MDWESMTALNLARDLTHSSPHELEQYLAVAEQQRDMYENAWFAARRVRTNAHFPDMPSLERPGEFESTEHYSPRSLEEIRRAAGEWYVESGALAQAWRYRVNEIKELLRDARNH